MVERESLSDSELLDNNLARAVCEAPVPVGERSNVSQARSRSGSVILWISAIPSRKNLAPSSNARVLSPRALKQRERFVNYIIGRQ